MADELFSSKEEFPNGDLTDIKIYGFDRPPLPPLVISYSLVYIRNGERILGYDNFEAHRGKFGSHHKHLGKKIVPYMFVDIWRLIEDFLKDAEAIENESKGS